MTTAPEHTPLGPITVPETTLVEIARQLTLAIISETEINRRKIAAQWLGDLHSVVAKWSAELIRLVKTYPGFQDRTDLVSYQRFFKSLETKQAYMQYRDKSMRERLCRPIERLYDRFPVDFDWLKARHSGNYDRIYKLIQDAYDGEHRIVLLTENFINSVYGLDVPEIREKYGHYGSKPAEDTHDEFLLAHIKYRDTICQRINEYELLSAQSVYDLQRLGKDADLQLIPIEHADVRKNPGYIDPKTIIGLSGTPQAEHRVLYEMLAFTAGIIFLGSILVIAIFIPKPEPFQVKVFATVMAISAAGVATVMTGLVNAQIKLGTQLVIGATGALAVFVIVYLVNPAGLGQW